MSQTTDEREPRPARPLRADAQRNYDRLVAVARSAFEMHGADASLNEIAQTAGVGSGTLYRHFPSRESLIEAIVRDDLDAIRRATVDLLSHPSPYDALEGWLHSYVRNLTTCPGLASALMTGLADESSDLHESGEAVRAAGAQVLARAQAAGEVRADAEMTDVLDILQGIVLANERLACDPRRTERLIGLVMDGLRPQPAHVRN